MWLQTRGLDLRPRAPSPVALPDLASLTNTPAGAWGQAQRSPTSRALAVCRGSCAGPHAPGLCKDTCVLASCREENRGRHWGVCRMVDSTVTPPATGCSNSFLPRGSGSRSPPSSLDHLSLSSTTSRGPETLSILMPGASEHSGSVRLRGEGARARQPQSRSPASSPLAHLIFRARSLAKGQVSEAEKGRLGALAQRALMERGEK